MWWLAGAGSLAVFGVAFALMPEAAVARRVFGQFVFLIALPLAVVLGWGLYGLAALGDIAVPIWQALIAGLVISAGWLTTAIFGGLGRERTKAERLRDYHKALYAEIGNTLEILWGQGHAEAEAEGILQRMRADEDFVPFVPREHHDFVYDALLANIEVLPRVTIDVVVAYYSRIKGIAALAEDMRGEAFKSLPQARRIMVYSDFIEMRRQAFLLGQHALRLIKAFAEHGPVAAHLVAANMAGLNSRDAGPSAPSAGSE